MAGQRERVAQRGQDYFDLDPLSPLSSRLAAPDTSSDLKAGRPIDRSYRSPTFVVSTLFRDVVDGKKSELRIDGLVTHQRIDECNHTYSPRNGRRDCQQDEMRQEECVEADVQKSIEKPDELPTVELLEAFPVAKTVMHAQAKDVGAQLCTYHDFVGPRHVRLSWWREYWKSRGLCTCARLCIVGVMIFVITLYAWALSNIKEL